MKLNLFYYPCVGGDLVRDMLPAANVFENPSADDWNNAKGTRIVVYSDISIQARIAIQDKTWMFRYYDREQQANHRFARYIADFRTQDNTYLPESLNDLREKRIPAPMVKRIFDTHGYYVKQLLADPDSITMYHFDMHLGIDWNDKRLYLGYLNPIDIDDADIAIDIKCIVSDGGKSLMQKIGLPYKQEYSAMVDRFLAEYRTCINTVLAKDVFNEGTRNS